MEGLNIREGITHLDPAGGTFQHNLNIIGYAGIMEKKMETTEYSVGIILGLGLRH